MAGVKKCTIVFGRTSIESSTGKIQIQACLSTVSTKQPTESGGVRNDGHDIDLGSGSQTFAQQQRNLLYIYIRSADYDSGYTYAVVSSIIILYLLAWLKRGPAQQNKITVTARPVEPWRK